MKRIGIISDTHSVLKNSVFSAFKGVDMILHAGDIGDANIITDLESLANTIAVYGNMDDLSIREKTKKEITLELEGLRIHLSHNERAADQGFDIIIQGHTHSPINLYRGKTLFINPGSADPARSRPSGQASVVILELNNKRIISSSILFI